MDNSLKTTLEILFGGILAITPGVLAWITATKAAKRQNELERARLPIELQSAAGDAADKVATVYNKLIDDLQRTAEKSALEFQKRLTDVEDRLRLAENKADDQEKKLDAQDKKIFYLERGIRKLVDQLISLGVEPVFNINGNGS